MAVEVNFKSMDDFEPEQVAKQVKPLKDLLDLRTRLSDLRGSLRRLRVRPDRVVAERVVRHIFTSGKQLRTHVVVTLGDSVDLIAVRGGQFEDLDANADGYVDVIVGRRPVDGCPHSRTPNIS